MSEGICDTNSPHIVLVQIITPLPSASSLHNKWVIRMPVVEDNLLFTMEPHLGRGSAQPLSFTQDMVIWAGYNPCLYQCRSCAQTLNFITVQIMPRTTCFTLHLVTGNIFFFTSFFWTTKLNNPCHFLLCLGYQKLIVSLTFRLLQS